MKILQIIQKPQLRGAEIFACQLAVELKKKGHQIDVLFLYGKENKKLKFNLNFLSLNGSQKNRFLNLKAYKKLALVIKENKYDIVQANAGDTLKYAVFSKLLFGFRSPLIFRNASTMSLYLKTSLLKKVLYKFLLSKCKTIISVSKYSMQDLTQLYPKLKIKTTVIPIGVQCDNLNIDANLSWDTTKINIVHVGGFTFEKNHEELIQIFNGFCKVNPKAHLHLLGDGILRQKIEDLVDELNLKDKVSFYGFVKNPINYIRQAKMLVLPSVIEGLPAVIVEAMLVKTPVIANNVGGVSEVVINNKTGFLIEKHDTDTYVEYLNYVCNNDTSLIVKNAHELVLKNYCNKTVSNKFEKCYLNLLSSEN